MLNGSHSVSQGRRWSTCFFRASQALLSKPTNVNVQNDQDHTTGAKINGTSQEKRPFLVFYSQLAQQTYAFASKLKFLWYGNIHYAPVRDGKIRPTSHWPMISSATLRRPPGWPKGCETHKNNSSLFLGVLLSSGEGKKNLNYTLAYTHTKKENKGKKN